MQVEKPRSKHKVIGGVRYKTCPACGVWAPVADFGERQVAPGEFIPQSYCGPCRTAASKKGGAA